MKRFVLVIFTLCFSSLSLSCFGAGFPFTEEAADFARGAHQGTVLASDGVKFLINNLLKNPGFEDGFNHWYPNNAALDSGHSGKFGSKIIGGAGPGASTDYIQVDNNSGSLYTLKAWLKCNVTVSAYYFRICFFTKDGVMEISHTDLKSFDATSGWIYFSQTVGGAGSGAGITFPSSCARVKIDHTWWNGSGNPSGEGWMDDVLFYKGTSISTSAYFISAAHDCGEPLTGGRIYHEADVTDACSIVFNTKGADAEADLAAAAWSDTYFTNGAEIKTDAYRFIQYRAVLYRTAYDATPILKQVKVSSPLKSVSVQPRFIVRAGEKMKFDFSFDIDMNTGFSPDVALVGVFGESVMIPGAEGYWTGSRFITGETTVPSLFSYGPAAVKVTGGVTAGGRNLSCSNNGIVIVDGAEIINRDKVEFYPDPFSPNGDGKCDETKLLFSLDSPASVRLTIWDLRGKLVNILAEGSEYSGVVQIPWDGTDLYGRVLPVGIYLYQLSYGSIRKTGTIALVK